MTGTSDDSQGLRPWRCDDTKGERRCRLQAGHAPPCDFRTFEDLEAEIERLRAALTEIGTECRFFADADRCSITGRLGGPVDRENWCGGCVVLDALGVPT